MTEPSDPEDFPDLEDLWSVFKNDYWPWLMESREDHIIRSEN